MGPVLLIADTNDRPAVFPQERVAPDDLLGEPSRQRFLERLGWVVVDAQDGAPLVEQTR